MRNDGKMSEYRKTDDTLISVIVPVYKVEQYLEMCEQHKCSNIF